MLITKRYATENYVEKAVVDLVNSAPETLDTLGELAAAFKENSDMVATLDAAITSKKDATSYITSFTNPLVLNDNTEYRLTDVSSLVLQFPSNKFEVWMKVLFSAAGNISVTFPNETRYIGTAPTFRNSETWEISIKDGVAICWRVQ